jgi:hypothetical protein
MRAREGAKHLRRATEELKKMAIRPSSPCPGGGVREVRRFLLKSSLPQPSDEDIGFIRTSRRRRIAQHFFDARIEEPDGSSPASSLMRFDKRDFSNPSASFLRNEAPPRTSKILK